MATARVPPEVVDATRILAGDDRVRHDSITIALHWSTALLVVAQFALAETWGFAERPTRHLLIATHMSLGILLSAVIVARLLWRLTRGRRLPPAGTGFVEQAARGVHGLLYGLLVSEAVLGYVFRWSGNEAMSFFGLLIPPPFPPFSKAAHHLVAQAHDYIGWTIVILAGGHAAAALFHHYRLHDDVLWRMLPGRRARERGRAAPAPAEAVRR